MALRNAVVARSLLARRDQRRVSDSAYPITRLPNYTIQGFTLIELMVVMALIVILATIGRAQYRNSLTYAKEATLKEDLFRMRDAIDQYYADRNEYPKTVEALVCDGYLRRLPKDSFTNSDSTWVPVPAEPDASNPIAEPEVFDVKSGSELTAIDGSRYSDW